MRSLEVETVMQKVISSLILALLCPVLNGCSEDVPDVECGWVLPEPATERVPSRSGFNLRVQVRGIYTAEELPAVRFFSDREGDNPDYPNGLLLETGIAIDAELGCENGCLAGGRLETTISPGVHNITASALTPRGTAACEVTITVTANSPPVVTAVTLSPTSPGTGDDVHFTAEVSDPDGDDFVTSNSWTGPDGKEPLLGAFLTSLHTELGQQWLLSVTADDGIDRGDPLETAFSIANTPPDAPTVTIAPVPGRANATLACTATDLDDPDPSQDLEVSWSWQQDGIDTPHSSNHVDPAETSAGETWTCRAVVSDGSDDSEPGEASTTILDDLPVTSPVDLDTVALIAGILPDQYVGDVNQVGSPGDIDGDGLAEMVLTVNNSLCDTTFPFACNGQAHAYLFAGSTSAVPSSLGDHTTDLQPATGYRVLAPSRVGDLNGDGVDDLVLPYRTAAWTQTTGTSGVYLLFGDLAGLPAVVDLETDAVKITATSESAGTLIGQQPCPVGDLDGDGFDDLAITAPGHSNARGSLFVIYGHPGNWISGYSPGSLQPGFQVTGGPENLAEGDVGNGLGQACAGPIDLNADGRHDLAVSAPRGGVVGGGWVLVFFGSDLRWSGEINASMADIIISGEDIISPTPTYQTTTFGFSMAALGDYDGDGVDDMAISGLGPLDEDEHEAGTVWIASGGDPNMLGSVNASDLSYRIEGEGNIGFCGHSTGVDLNGDGLGDLACGDTRADDAVEFDVPGTPSVRVFTGSLGSIDATRSYSSAELVFTAAASDHRIGTSLARLSDRDGDLYDELLIGAPGADVPHTDTGGVYLVDLNP